MTTDQEIEVRAIEIAHAINEQNKFVASLGEFQVYASPGIPDDFNGSIIYVSNHRYNEMVSQGLIHGENNAEG